MGDVEDSGELVSLQEGLLCQGDCLNEGLPIACGVTCGPLRLPKGLPEILRDFGARLSVSVLMLLNPTEPFHNTGI